ncbi:MAG TPA: cyclic nucleotide-binding domain-containing protein [Candidatus Dormibacteraeota bacterium]|jgi:uncharacterized protein YhbP (UPF0306 family)|nr:cyclic nucleotide-binding domain-containing protein [Candidatus Dormibacteraeota bacterium]
MALESASVPKVIPGEVLDYLRLHHIITVSTSSFTGMPHADTVVYANDSSSIYFFVGEGTQMMRNIKDSRSMSFTIDDYTVDWRKVRELQGVGRCWPATPEDSELAMKQFAAKYARELIRPVGVLHRLVPFEVHFVDYDYATAGGQTSPEIHSRVIEIDEASRPPSRGPVATSLDQHVYEAGQIIFEPGASAGLYYVIVDGAVEIRGEGYGSDQTVVRLGPGKFFGDQQALRGQRGALTCHAVTHTVLLAVERESMRDLLLSETGQD